MLEKMSVARVTVAIAASFLLSAAIATASPAATVSPVTKAAPAITGQPCHGSSCIGKLPTLSNANGNCVQGAYNPYSGTWADGAYDVATISLGAIGGGGSVTLRYSPYCGANWARWNGGDAYTDYWVETADGRTASGYSGNSPNYTTMVDGTQLARVCADEAVAEVSGCTGWY